MLQKRLGTTDLNCSKNETTALTATQRKQHDITDKYIMDRYDTDAVKKVNKSIGSTNVLSIPRTMASFHSDVSANSPRAPGQPPVYAIHPGSGFQMPRCHPSYGGGNYELLCVTETSQLSSTTLFAPDLRLPQHIHNYTC